MRHKKTKLLVLLLGLLLPAAWCGAMGTDSTDGYSSIQIKEKNVQGVPKGSTTIQAYIDGHTLTVAFAESLGYVQVRITTADGKSAGTGSPASIASGVGLSHRGSRVESPTAAAMRQPYGAWASCATPNFAA